MAEPKVWKFSSGYAGITKTGKRIFEKTKAKAERTAGVTTKKSTKTRKKTMAKTKKGGGRRGSRIIGNLGLKGLITGGALLLATDRVIPNVGGVYAGAVKEIAAGAIGKMAGVGGATLISSGAMKASAITLSRLLSGGLGAIGVAPSGNGGGYDY